MFVEYREFPLRSSIATGFRSFKVHAIVYDRCCSHFSPQMGETTLSGAFALTIFNRVVPGKTVTFLSGQEVSIVHGCEFRNNTCQRQTGYCNNETICFVCICGVLSETIYIPAVNLQSRGENSQDPAGFLHERL